MFPKLAELLAEPQIGTLNEAQFVDLCHHRHATQECANRTEYRTYGIVQSCRAWVTLSASTIMRVISFGQKSSYGGTTVQTIHWILHGGAKAAIPDRIWETIVDIAGLGLPRLVSPRDRSTSCKCVPIYGE